MAFLKEFDENVNYEKHQQATKMYATLLRFQRDKVFETFDFFLAKQRLLSFADNIWQQFGPRSGLTDCLSNSGSKLFNTLIVFLK